MQTINRTSAVIYMVFRGSLALYADDNFSLISEKAGRWSKDWLQTPLISTVTIAPDERPVTTPGWPGGTWRGTCGATLWVDDPERNIIHLQELVSNDHVRSTQRRHRSGHSFGGFRVECQLRHRHDGECRESNWHWAWAHRSDAMENVARCTGVQQLEFAEESQQKAFNENGG